MRFVAKANAIASRNASMCRLTSSKCWRNRGERLSASGTSQPALYLSVNLSLCEWLRVGAWSDGGCGGSYVMYLLGSSPLFTSSS